jgi:hypothetical protein
MSNMAPTGFDRLEIVLVVDIRGSHCGIRLPHCLKLLYLYLSPSVLLYRIIRLTSGLNVSVSQNPPSLVPQAHYGLCLDLLLNECRVFCKEYRVFHRLRQCLTLIGALDGVIGFDIDALNCVWYLRNVAGPPGDGLVVIIGLEVEFRFRRLREVAPARLLVVLTPPLLYELIIRDKSIITLGRFGLSGNHNIPSQFRLVQGDLIYVAWLINIFCRARCNLIQFFESPRGQ